MNSIDECRLSPTSCPSEIGATGVVTDSKRPIAVIRGCAQMFVTILPCEKKTKSTRGELSGGRFEIEPRFDGDKRQDRVHRERYREIRKPGKRDNRLAFSLFELTKQHPGILIGWLL